MIKVNLLDSVTDKGGSVAAVEARVANPRLRAPIMFLAVFALLVGAVAFDYTSARSARAEVQAELERQQQTAAKMEAVKKELAELEKKTQEVQVRIDAIKKLRASQQGPVAVLSAINERIPKLADFKLESIEQKGGALTIKGDSPSESAVTQFGRSLEFSSGLFTDVSIETKRAALEKGATDAKPAADGAAAPPDAKAQPQVKPTTVTFTLKCKYNAPGAEAAKTPAPPANQVAQK